MRVESFRDGAGTIVPPGTGPRVQAGRLTIKRLTIKMDDSGSDARSLEAPIVQVTDG
jgi:hypothetical protein